MELLKGYGSPKRIRAALGKLPEKLPNAYDDIMERIERQAGDQKTMALAALKWITYAKRRLRVVELLHAIALALEPDSTDIDDDDLIDVDLLLSSCAGLVILQEDRIIRLVHYTTQDYLEKRFPKADANTSLAESCLTYLALDKFSDAPANDDKALRRLMERYPLSIYAAHYWEYHARHGKEKDVEHAILSTLRTQEKRDIMDRFDFFLRYDFLPPLGSSLLHFISRYGFSWICATLLDPNNILFRSY